MRRTFLSLAIILIVCLVATIAVGFTSFFMERSTQKEDVFILHFYLGLGTSLGVLLVHCLIFTYFLGTGRWVKEVGLAYRLPDEQLPKLTRELKRSTFPPALHAMLVTIAAAAAGAGAQLQQWPWYVHAGLAFAALAVNLWAFRIEYRNLCINGEAIEAVLREVDRIRAERGLPSNAEAIEQERLQRS